MNADDQGVCRHLDGSIDFNYYRSRAILLRNDTFRRLAFRISAAVKRATGQLFHL